MSVTFASPRAEQVAEVDRLVTPWLRKGDEWRKDRDGVPEADDMIVVIARLRGMERPDLTLSVALHGYEFIVFEADNRQPSYGASSLSEALLAMLADDLHRTCATCGGYDGHDSTCAEVGE